MPVDSRGAGKLHVGADGRMVDGNGPKDDNAGRARDAKIELRRRVLAHVSPAHVFDAFCGLGEMRREAWTAAASWTGCDQRPWDPSQPARFIADNLDVLRAIDLSRFNIFDFDAYGSPWEQMIVVSDRRRWAPGERGAVVMTDGSGLSGQFGRLRRILAPLLGEAADGRGRPRFATNDAAVPAWASRAGVRLLRRWEATKAGQKGVRYTALVFEGVSA